MNVLIEFIKRNFHYLLFVILQIVSMVLIYNNMHYPRFVISKASSAITGPVYEVWFDVVKHFNLEKLNEDLVKQNIRLLEKDRNNFLMPNDSVVTLTEKKKLLYEYSYAHVIHNTIHKKHNYLILDKGSKDGVSVDMAVISPDGVVGVVNDVSRNFSSVLSILHPDARLSARVKPSGQIGTVIWEENNPEYAYLHDIPQHIKVEIGDSVVTSGYSNVFPKDILIGIVREKKNNPKNSFFTIKVKLSTNFNHLNTVYLVKNLYKSELDTLKSRFKND